MSAVAAPADRRFRRSHVKPSRRKRDWRRSIRPMLRNSIAGVVVAYGLYRMSSLAASMHLLQIDRIVVAGNRRLSNGEVLAVLNGLRGENLVLTDLDAWRRRLLSSPWIRDAGLRRSLPSTIEVLVSERQPMGIARLGGEM